MGLKGGWQPEAQHWQNCSKNDDGKKKNLRFDAVDVEVIVTCLCVCVWSGDCRKRLPREREGCRPF